MTEEAFRILGTPVTCGILVVSDHASNRVPDDIDLGIDRALLDQHVAIDIGVAKVAERLAAMPQFAAFLGNVSRLVCDFNREEEAPAVVPHASDGHDIPGNLFDVAGREERLARFHRPYHTALAQLIRHAPPSLIVSLHSFTPQLTTRPEEMRPWQVGVLYNEDDRASRLAIPLLEDDGLVVGDQQPYSGKLLNATMNIHAEANGVPYVGIEVRQDQITDATGQALWAERLGRIASTVRLELTQ
ncbi:N-formylglutamate amidohydrolase [Altererythrobacter sp. Root672]|uniref:N-formylglutamate amidohydrolase n=1 Tax=Altererythrobacter sp. Root672 TaxID=1736584 RepID=UPI0006FFB7FE|nr:N-formylglutamate amidohydrolase [Altererythrobacter sp. Root672]KRA83511.1 N-formylglutamate amidohydrolase [Altererythrobacter sp. Root672]